MSISDIQAVEDEEVIKWMESVALALSIERCCSAVCHMGTEEKPCWGNITLLEEDWHEDTGESYLIHSCEGHIDYGEYEEPPEGCKTMRVDDDAWRELKRANG